MTGGIIEITIPYELWDNTNTDPIQLPKGTYKALIENPSKVLYIHVVGTTREDILNILIVHNVLHFHMPENPKDIRFHEDILNCLRSLLS